MDANRCWRRIGLLACLALLCIAAATLAVPPLRAQSDTSGSAKPGTPAASGSEPAASEQPATEDAPAASETAPAAGAASPSAQEAAPANGEATPAAGEATPTTEQAAPAAAETAPAAGEAAPETGAATPAAGAPATGAAAAPEAPSAPGGASSAGRASSASAALGESAAAPSGAGTLDWGADFRTWSVVTGYVLSFSHGNRLVQTYITPKAAATVYKHNAERALLRKTTGFEDYPPGTRIAMESWLRNAVGGPGAAGPVFFMRKHESGYDAAGNDWEYAFTHSDLQLIAAGHTGKMQFCKTCHQGAKDRDFVWAVRR